MNAKQHLDLDGFNTSRRVNIPPPPPAQPQPDPVAPAPTLPPVDPASTSEASRRSNPTRSETAPTPMAGPSPRPTPTTAVSVRLTVSVPASLKRWLVKQAETAGIVQADVFASALTKYERRIRAQFDQPGRYRRMSVPERTSLDLYLQPSTADQLQQLSIATGAKRSDLVTRALDMASSGADT